MRVLITGANGFLGFYLTRLLLEKGYEVVATGKGPCRLPFAGQDRFAYHELDFTRLSEVANVFNRYAIHVIVHCGAISKPDECEKDKDLAYHTNVTATSYLLEQAIVHQSFFIFLSTDFIFSGEKGMYVEDDQPGPVNYYGQTKLDSEAEVKKFPFPWAIVRTVLVYGPAMTGRGNILTVVKEKLEKKETYNVFDDQVRTPTYVEDLATGIASIIEKKAEGVFHISGEEVFTPYEMSCAAADWLGLDKTLIKKVTAPEFVQPAKRPAKTGFNISKAKEELGFQPRSFREGLSLTFPPTKS